VQVGLRVVQVDLSAVCLGSCEEGADKLGLNTLGDGGLGLDLGLEGV